MWSKVAEKVAAEKARAEAAEAANAAAAKKAQDDVNALSSYVGTIPAKQAGLVIPVIITVYQDRSFSLEFKSPPASVLLKKEAGLAKGSGVPNKNKVGKVTKEQLAKIVEMKKADLNTTDPEAAMRMIAGTARNMGIEVVD